MRKIKSLLFIAVAMAVCHSLYGQSNQLTKVLARYQEAMKIYESQISKLSARVNSLQDTMATYQQQIKTLNDHINSVQKENHQLKSDMAKLQELLDAEVKNRQKDMDAMMKNIANETAGAINQAVGNVQKSYEAARQTTETSGSGPVGTGEFFEHKVEKGHTLSVIAKAYNVSVSDIKKANRMNNDIIRVGQILYIPKK